MRELRAILRAYFIYGTHVIDQELARLKLVYPITCVFFLQEPFLSKSFGRHLKVCRYPKYVCSPEGRSHGLTAVGTFSTMHILPYTFVSFLYQLWHVMRYNVV